MRIRIIAGSLGGRKIQAPDNSRTHPMSERIRGSLFNILGDRVANAYVLDVFAGTGALGIETLSRGASQTVFVEKDRVAIKVIQENIQDLNINDRAKVVLAGVSSWCDTYKGPKFDLIFADPPYHDMQFSTVEKLFSLLKPNGLMVLSHPGRERVPTYLGVVVVDNRSYGDAALAFYRLEQ